MERPLHITTSQRIIRTHLRMRHTAVDQAHDEVKRLALAAHQATELDADRRLREQLERATGVSIVELAAIAETWI